MENLLNIKAIDLFCGAGGVTHGLLNAGIDVIAGFDIDSSLNKVYEELVKSLTS